MLTQKGSNMGLYKSLTVGLDHEGRLWLPWGKETTKSELRKKTLTLGNMHMATIMNLPIREVFFTSYLPPQNKAVVLFETGETRIVDADKIRGRMIK